MEDVKRNLVKKDLQGTMQLSIFITILLILLEIALKKLFQVIITHWHLVVCMSQFL